MQRFRVEKALPFCDILPSIRAKQVLVSFFLIYFKERIQDNFLELSANKFTCIHNLNILLFSFIVTEIEGLEGGNYSFYVRYELCEARGIDFKFFLSILHKSEFVLLQYCSPLMKKPSHKNNFAG